MPKLLHGTFEKNKVKIERAMEEFPRSTAGKTLKRLMREPYWAGRDTKI